MVPFALLLALPAVLGASMPTRIPARLTRVRMAAGPPPPPARAKPGYYQRPSAAVEQGGAFYIPGLEGSRLRVVAGSVLGFGLLLNRFVATPGEPASSQLVSEVLGTIGIVVLFVQAAAQTKFEGEQARDELRAAYASRLREEQEMDATLAADATRAVRARWAASTLLKLTPARAVLWVEDEGQSACVRLRYGRFPAGDGSASPVGAAGIRALLPDGIPSGCVELGTDDDGSRLAPPPPLPTNTASVALCPCGEGVLVMTSERPAAFTELHLRRLEQCATLLVDLPA